MMDDMLLGRRKAELYSCGRGLIFMDSRILFFSRFSRVHPYLWASMDTFHRFTDLTLSILTRVGGTPGFPKVSTFAIPDPLEGTLRALRTDPLLSLSLLVGTGVRGGLSNTIPTTAHPSCTSLFDAQRKPSAKTAAESVKLRTVKRSGRCEGGEATSSSVWRNMIEP